LVADGIHRRGGIPTSSSRGSAGNPFQLTDIELEFVELMAKGFDPLEASRSLGISFSTGAQLQRRVREKLNALNDAHLRQMVQMIARAMPLERYAVLDV
jgi:DNA-binding CsgD family transcriptional regulator